MLNVFGMLFVVGFSIVNLLFFVFCTSFVDVGLG